MNRKNKERLDELIEGNLRFFEGKRACPNASPARRREVAEGQLPAAIVVSCSDSRVPPEVLFDRGIGDIFVVRTAGNVIDDTALGSIEYAVAHLSVRLIVVMGHSRCGAVGAALGGDGAEGHIGSVTKALMPAVEDTRVREGDAHDLASRRNVELTVEMLRSSGPILAPLGKELDIVGCYYDLDSGRIEVIC